ncbi:MAG TPA: transglutaminase domain-containing protein [Planctomycetota bacterium]|nr:transglutaminase domain-containing protein [Planctomycetota bacterium]
MDLYRTLRISLYLLVATGAFAISVAERSLFYLILIAVLGLLSYLLIDREKTKPISAELTAGLTLALLYLTLRPLHDDEHWQAHFPAAVAHFLCAWQGLLFFSVYGGPVLLTFCGSTLAIVVMSGVVQSGPSLVARVAVFLSVAVWTLYIHALWRSRQEFAGLPSILQMRSDKSPAERPNMERFRRLPEGAFWSTVSLVTGMTVACIILGIATFLLAPRIESLWVFFEKHGGPETMAPRSPIEAGSDHSPLVYTGDSDIVKVRDLREITTDSRVALRAQLPLAQITGAKDSVLLKGANFSEYHNGEWKPEPPVETLESKNGLPIAVTDPTQDGPIRVSRATGTEIVEPIALNTKQLFTAGPVVSVASTVRKIECDAEGSLRSAESASLNHYTLQVGTPNDPAALKESAVAEHHKIQRYVLQVGLSLTEREKLELLARAIVKDAPQHPAKARAMQRWLQTTHSYTRNLSDIDAQNEDPIAHFILAKGSGARGHCVYFASAFVVLCRLNNMPARFCTGFRASVTTTNGPMATLLALNSDAHAWAEVYYRNIGWVPYDPTPPESTSEPANVAQKKSPTQPPSALAINPATSAPGDEPSRGFVQDTWDSLINFDGRTQRKWYERLTGSQNSGAGGLLWGHGYGGWIGAVIAWVAIAAAMAWLVQLFARRSVRRKYAFAGSGSRSRAAVAFYNDLLQALSRRGFARQPGQTPREFAASVLRKGGEAFAPVREVTAIFEAVRYGGGDLEQDEFNRLQDALDKIKEMTF